MKPMNDISAGLSSSSVEAQIFSLDSIGILLAEWAELAVQALKASPNPFLIAERLHRIGPAAVGPLRSVLREDITQEVKVLAAIVLRKLGDKAGVPILIEVLRTKGIYSCLVARLLATNGDQEAGPAILHGLKDLDAKRVDDIVSYVEALGLLGLEIPNEMKFRLTQKCMPWQVRTLFEADLPPSTPQG